MYFRTAGNISVILIKVECFITMKNSSINNKSITTEKEMIPAPHAPDGDSVIFCEEKVVRDEFPDWKQAMKSKRTSRWMSVTVEKTTWLHTTLVKVEYACYACILVLSASSEAV